MLFARPALYRRPLRRQEESEEFSTLFFENVQPRARVTGWAKGGLRAERVLLSTAKVQHDDVFIPSQTIVGRTAVKANRILAP